MLPRTTAAGLLARRTAPSPSILCYNRSFTALASRTVIESRPFLNLSPSRPAPRRNSSIYRSSNLSSYFYHSPLPTFRKLYVSSFQHVPFDRQPPDRGALFTKPSKEHPANGKADVKHGSTVPQGTDEEVATAERRAERKTEEGRKEESSSGEEGKEKSKEDEVRKPSVDSTPAHILAAGLLQ